MYYFGTNLTEHGHYTWELSGEHMVKIGLLPKNTPFQPEELTRGLQKGLTAIYQGGGFTVVAIAGSPKDDRPGTKSVFWINETISFDEMMIRIKSNKLAMAIINQMPFDVIPFDHHGTI
jgi:hypothetical protein